MLHKKALLAFVFVGGADHRAHIDVQFSGRDRLDKLGRFLDRRGEIGVGKQTDRGCRRQQSFPHGCAFAPIGRVFEQTRGDRGLRRENLTDDFGGRVRRTIVYDDQFAARAGFLQVGEVCSQALADPLRFVESGDYE